MAAVMLFCASAASTASQDTDNRESWSFPAVSLQEFWDSEYARLNDRLSVAGEKSVPILRNGKPSLKGRQSFPYHNSQCLIWDSDRDPADIVLRRTRALLDHLKVLRGGKALQGLDEQLKELQERGQTIAQGSGQRRTLFNDVSKLRRTAAMSNPLLDFDEIVFMACGMGMGNPKDNGVVGGGVYTTLRGSLWQHMGFNSTQVRGEGLVVLSDWKSGSPKVRELLTPQQRQNRRFHSTFDISYAGKEALFSAQTFTAQDLPWGQKAKFNDNGEGPTHVFKVRLDGSDPVRLTKIGHNNGFPAYLPGGRIVYVSDYVKADNDFGWHRKEDRCGGWGIQLWSMKADGSDAFPISWHDSAEYHPVVDHDGKIVYSRWDYLDRNFDSAHHLWTCYPDGRDPRSPHGNYPYPHNRLTNGPKSPIQGDGRAARPWAEMFIRPIPGSPGKYTAIAGVHHRVLPGVPVMIDTNIRDDHMMSQVRIITGSDLPHEGVGVPLYTPQDEYYSPWPLSEDYYLMSTRENILLVDKFGNEVIIYRWDKPAQRGYPLSARPLRPRKKPPVIPTATYQGARSNTPAHKRATIFVSNAYESIDKWPEGTQIKALRILQYIPKPFIFKAFHVQKRVILGTVPVEDDGSAYFEAPVERLIYFQALDKDGLAVQSMRSGTYVHPGEQMTCMGCHEDRSKAPLPPAKPALALQRKPSPITPEVSGSNPISYQELVYNTVFQETCLDCHKKEGKGIQDFSFDGFDEWDSIRFPASELESYLWRSRAREGYHDKLDGGHRYVPGRFGARESRLGKLMLGSHRDRISEDEFHRVMLWLDANSIYSSIHKRGRTEPLLEYDPENRTGVETQRPLS